MQQKIVDQISGHPGWEGALLINSRNATVLYVGPGTSDPYNAPKTHKPHVICASEHCNDDISIGGTITIPRNQSSSGVPYQLASPTRPVNFQAPISGDSTKPSGPIYEELGNHTLIQANSQHFEVYNPFDAFAISNYWLQVFPFYDSIGDQSYPNQWQVSVDVYTYDPSTGNCNEWTQNGYVKQFQFTGAQAGDQVNEYIFGVSGSTGVYTVGATDVTHNVSFAYAVSIPGDTGNGQIQLGELHCTGNDRYEGAGGSAEVREDLSGADLHTAALTSSSDTWYYGFYDQYPPGTETRSVQSYLNIPVLYTSGATVRSNLGPPAYQQFFFDPTIDVFAKDQSGNLVNGLAVNVYNSAHNLIKSGYTPLTVEVSSGGTYYVDYDNYGSYTLSSMSNYPTVTSYSIASWGGEATVNVPASSIVQVFGNYATDSGCTCSLKVNSEDLNFNTISGLYQQLYQNGQQITAGWTPVTFSSLNAGTYTVYANNYCNTSTHTQYTFSRWGDGTTSIGDTINLQHGTTITAYYSIGAC